MSGTKLVKLSFLSFVRIFRLYGEAPPYGLNFVCRWKRIKRWDYLNEDGVPVHTESKTGFCDIGRAFKSYFFLLILLECFIKNSKMI